MSLLFLDSFDHYQTASIEDKWTDAGLGAITIAASSGRHGSGALDNSTSDTSSRLLTANTSEWFLVGLAHNFEGGDDTHLIWLGDVTNFFLVWLRIRADGGFDSLVGPDGPSAVLHGRTRAGLWHRDTWGYVEFRGRIHDSAGELHIYFNGRLESSVTGIDTTPTHQGAYQPTPPWRNVNISPNGKGDDFYVVNGGGIVDAAAGHLGDVHVECLYAQADSIAAGFHSDWTPLSGTDHGAMVDETLVDDDTSYNAETTLGDQDSYHHVDLAQITVGTIHGVQWVAALRAAAAGSRDVRLFSRPGATDRFGAVEAVATTDYRFFRLIQEQNPDLSAAWTPAAIDASQSGVEVNN